MMRTVASRRPWCLRLIRRAAPPMSDRDELHTYGTSDSLNPWSPTPAPAGEAMSDAALFAYLDEAYFAADFADEQCPDKVVLKFAFPRDTRVCSDLRETLASALRAASPRRSPDEGMSNG
jgi:hypothetical protein